MKFLIILILSIALAERLTIDMYTESLCPDCQGFISTSLKKALATEGIDKLVALRIIPYGNARRTKNSQGDWVFTCQHGTTECYGNIVQLCAQNRVAQLYAPNNELQQVQVVECIDSNLKRPFSNAAVDRAAAACSATWGYNTNDVIACANANEGQLLHLIAAQETDALVPAHQYVPWIVSERQHNTTDENLINWNYNENKKKFHNRYLQILCLESRFLNKSFNSSQLIGSQSLSLKQVIGYSHQGLICLK